MTCIVALKTPSDKIVMAGDSGNCDGFGAYTIMKNQNKIFKINDMLMGVAGNSRIGQILNHDFKFPKDEFKDPFLFLIKKFIPLIKSRIEKEGLNKEGKMDDTELLIGYKTRLFRMNNNYSIIESVDDYDAIGCGRYDARGALFALKYVDSINYTEKAKIAVSAAINADVNIKSPIKTEILT